MARKGIAVRTLRTGIVRLGYTTKGQGRDLPKDTDQFVAKKADGITDEILKAYQAQPIKGAADESYAIGRQLRCMLPWEFDRKVDGKEVGVQIVNRAWAHSKWKCMGDGDTAADPGEATCRDEAWAKRIGQATSRPAEPDGRGSWRVTCLGSDCPKWLRAQEHDQDAACHLEMRIQVILLHPTTDPESPDYMRQLGWIQISSGSWNGTIDVKSGLTMIRSLVGRTAYIPFSLRRVPRTIIYEGRRTTKATLLVDYDNDEVLRFGYGPPQRAMLRPAVRRELLELASAEARYEQGFNDIDPAARALAGRSEPAPPPVPALPAAREHNGHDRDQAIEDAQAATTEEPDAPIDWRKLSQDERDDLKKLCGGVPGEAQSLVRFREMVEACYRVLGVPRDNEWTDYPGTAPGHVVPLGLLTNRHFDWITQKLAAEEEARATAAEPDPDEEQGADVPLVQGQLVP